MPQTPKKIAIAGAGLVGSLLAVLLAQKGHQVKIYERRPDMRKLDIGGGRSINLALSDRGWRALEKAGVADEVKKNAIPMYGRMIHNEDGTQTFQAYGKENQAIYSVSRGGLNMILMDFAEKNGVKIIFDKRIEKVDLDQAIMHFEDQSSVDADILFGADGAFSSVRLSMQMTDRFEYSQHYLEHGYKELSIPPGKKEKWQLEKNALHIWPRKSFMLIALPNIDGSFTCTLFAPFEGENSFADLTTPEQVEEYFHVHFKDALPLMATLTEDFFNNPTSSLVTVKCHPWVYKDQVALIGDAAHAIVPFYGQGMNAGFEDCTILENILKVHGDDWAAIFHEYQRERKENGDAIADLAVLNFIEMRDLVADPDFLLRKKVEKRLMGKIPHDYLPLYSIVTFSDLPYKYALKEVQLQNDFFRLAFSRGLIHENISEEDLNKLSEIWLKQYKLK